MEPHILFLLAKSACSRLRDIVQVVHMDIKEAVQMTQDSQPMFRTPLQPSEVLTTGTMDKEVRQADMETPMAEVHTSELMDAVRQPQIIEMIAIQVLSE